MFFPARFRSPTVVAMAFVATHNHYVIDSGSKLFKQTSPVINPQPGTNLNCLTEWCGFLNSSLACFWLKSVCFPKGGDQVGREGARVRRTLWDEHYNFNATPLKRFPIVVGSVRSYAERLTDLGDRIKQCLPNEILDGFDWSTSEGGLQIALKDVVENRKATVEAIIAQMIHLQEELDWYCYRLYGLIDEDITSRSKSFSIQLGQRAFEIVLARKMAAGETQTTWFERHGSTPIIELPAEWPDDYRQLVERRIALIESDPNIRLIEQPEYKRRWNTEPWDSQLERALREWLLDRLEGYFDFDGRMKDLSQRREGAKEDEKSQSLCTPAVLREISLYSVAKLADVARQDTEFQQVGELFRDDLAFDVQKLVEDLVAAECVPLLPVLRYKPSGLIKRGVWERTWDLQRQEDAIDARTKLPSTDPQHLSADAARDLKQKQVGNIPVPSKYDSKDFLDSNFWRLRGKLDVPKERWISFPHCEGPDGTPVIAWAGYDHLQQARAISAYYVRVQTEFGGTDDARLIPLLACLLELIPWLKQWHNEPDPAFDGMRMGDYFEGFVNEEARQLNKTIPEIKGWTPPKKVAKGQRGKVPKVKQE